MILALVVCVAVFFGIGVPVAISLGLATALALFVGALPLEVVPTRLLGGVDSFVLLAIPFFMLAGQLMVEGGFAARLVGFAQLLVGWIKGGLGMANIVTSVEFADISGSCSADTAAVGSVMIPGMISRGYSPAFSAAVQAAGGSLGMLFPPAISFIIYATVANVSISRLFLSGILPGILMALSFMVVIYLISRKRNYPVEKFPGRQEAWRIVREGIPALVAPIIVVGGIVSGVFTPTEAGVVAVVYVLLVCLLIYRSFNLRKMITAAANAMATASMVMFIVANATLLSWVFVTQSVPQLVSTWLIDSIGNQHLLLLCVMVMLAFIHTVMETNSTTIVVVPVLLPILSNMGQDAFTFGILLMMNSAIGIILPPIGLNIYIASGLANVPLEKAAKEILPFVAIIIVDMIIVTAFPEIITVLPRLFGQ